MSTKLQIIGLAGTNGSGKDAVGEILAAKHNYLFISVTDLLRDELERRGLPPAREHMRTLSAEWRRELGLGVLIDKAVSQYDKVRDQYAGLVMASVRNPGEADEVHALGGTMVWIDADPRIRYERVTKAVRHERRAVDDQKSYDQFLADEQAEMHIPKGGDSANLDMSSVKQRCDLTIDTTATSLGDMPTLIGQALPALRLVL